MPTKRRYKTLPGKLRVVQYTVKCHIQGCRRRKSGWLTTHRSHLGGGAFYDGRGKFLADLREVHFVCSRHGISDGSAPFLYEDKE